MAGYWDSAIKKIFKDADEIEEDWRDKSVEFQISAFGDSKVSLGFEQLKRLSVLLGTEDIRVKVEPDGRYADQGDGGAVVHFTANKVNFPAPREA